MTRLALLRLQVWSAEQRHSLPFSSSSPCSATGRWSISTKVGGALFPGWCGDRVEVGGESLVCALWGLLVSQSHVTDKCCVSTTVWNPCQITLFSQLGTDGISNTYHTIRHTVHNRELSWSIFLAYYSSYISWAYLVLRPVGDPWSILELPCQYITRILELSCQYIITIMPV